MLVGAGDTLIVSGIAGFAPKIIEEKFSVKSTQSGLIMGKLSMLPLPRTVYVVLKCLGWNDCLLVTRDQGHRSVVQRLTRHQEVAVSFPGRTLLNVLNKAARGRQWY